MRVFASTSESVVLLGKICELEIEAERAKDERLGLRFGIGQRLRDVGRPEASCCSRRAPNRLDQLQQPRAFLFDEHAAENRPEQPYIPSERRGRVASEGLAHDRQGYESSPSAANTA